MPSPDPEVQGTGSALAAHVVCGGHFYRWAPEVVASTEAVEVVPREVAERLAEALERIVDLYGTGGEDESLTEHEIALNAAHEFRAVFPRAVVCGRCEGAVVDPSRHGEGWCVDVSDPNAEEA